MQRPTLNNYKMDFKTQMDPPSSYGIFFSPHIICRYGEVGIVSSLKLFVQLRHAEQWRVFVT